MTWVGAIACKVSHDLSSRNPLTAKKRFESLLIILVDGTVFSVACTSDFEILIL